MKKYDLKSRSIIYTWVISYILILLLPISISLVMYFRVHNLVTTEVNRTNNIFLSQVQQNLDYISNEVESFAAKIALDLYIQDAVQIDLPMDGEKRYKLYELSKQLRGYKMQSSSIGKFFVYLKNSDFIVDNISSLSTDDYFTVYDKEFNEYDNDRWKNVLSQYYKGEYALNKDNNITYIKSIPINSFEALGNIVINIDKDVLTRAIGEAEDINQGDLIILDKNNRKILEPKDMQFGDKINYEDLQSEKGIKEIKYNNQKYIAQYITSKNNSWKYLYVIKDEVYQEKIKTVSNLTKISIVISMLLGLSLAYILLKKNYKPIKTLIESLYTEGETVDQGKNLNEYQFIQEVIKKNRDEKEQFYQRIVNQKNILKTRFIERLLKGKTSSITISDSLTSFDIEFKSDKFAVMLFYMDEFSESFIDMFGLDTEESIKLSMFAIENILQEILGKDNQVLMTEIDGMAAALINFESNDLKEIGQILNNSVNKLNEVINKYYKTNFTISVSDIHTTIEGINNGYNETLEAIEYKIVMGVDGVIFYKDIISEEDIYYYYPLEKEQQLINHIKIGDFENSKNVIEEIFDKNMYDQNISPRKAQLLSFALISTLIKCVTEMGSVSEKGFVNELKNIESIVMSKSIQHIKKEVLQFIKVLSDESKENKRGKTYKVKYKVEDYVVSNYEDENLSISAIADNFSMHPSYISKLFKAETGEGILDFINKVRIEKAKEVMTNNLKLNLDEVSKLVGYSNVRTFTRAFSKHEGITPGKYKEIILNSKDV